MLYAERDKSLAGVAAFLAIRCARSSRSSQRMLTTPHLPDGPHPVVAQTAREMLNKSENELSGVVSTAKACLTLYEDPIIARNTATVGLPDRRPDERAITRSASTSSCRRPTSSGRGRSSA